MVQEINGVSKAVINTLGFKPEDEKKIYQIVADHTNNHFGNPYMNSEGVVGRTYYYILKIILTISSWFGFKPLYGWDKVQEIFNARVKELIPSDLKGYENIEKSILTRAAHFGERWIKRAVEMNENPVSHNQIESELNQWNLQEHLMDAAFIRFIRLEKECFISGKISFTA